MKFKFKYTKVPGPPGKKFFSRPLIDIVLVGPSGRLTVSALLDTGADYCLFPSDLAALIGIGDYTQGIAQPILTAGGTTSPVYYHRVKIQVVGSKEIDEILGGFGSGIPTALLGQIGFFDRYNVLLRYRRGTFELSR